MNEAYETCTGCEAAGTAFLIIILTLFVIFMVEWATDGEFSEWVAGWIKHWTIKMNKCTKRWIDKLPKPKDDD